MAITTRWFFDTVFIDTGAQTCPRGVLIPSPCQPCDACEFCPGLRKQQEHRPLAIREESL